MKKFFIWLLRPIIEAVLADTKVEIKSSQSTRYA